MTSRPLYRKAALDHYFQRMGQGDVLRLTPEWSRWAYRAVLLAALALPSYLLLARIDAYCEGPAVVRVDGRTQLTASVSAVVEAVHVWPGQRVERGAPLVTFQRAEERSTLTRVQQEIDARLVRLLLDPSAASAGDALSALAAERQHAQSRLSKRELVAPQSALVSDVRVRQGQRVDAGDPILALLGSGHSVKLVAMLPGHFRPELRVGAPLRMSVKGYSHSRHSFPISSISDEVIGPSELRRFLDPQIADSVHLTEPVVLAAAAIPARVFEVNGSSFEYFDGMQAHAEARLRRERLLFVLFPSLKQLWGHARK